MGITSRGWPGEQTAGQPDTPARLRGDDLAVWGSAKSVRVNSENQAPAEESLRENPNKIKENRRCKFCDNTGGACNHAAVSLSCLRPGRCRSRSASKTGK